MTHILEGKPLAARILDRVAERVTKQKTRAGMAAILVGDDPASHLYVRLKAKACKRVGIYFEKHTFAANASTDEIIDLIEKLNQRIEINGILVQLPLPSQDTDAIIASIDPNKDIDGFHPKNLERLRNGQPSLVSPVALGIMKFVDEAKKAGAIIYKASLVCSRIFAEPIFILLTEQKMSAERVDPKDPDLATKTKKSDLIISAVGKPRLISEPCVQDQATLIDVGTTKINDNVLGDVSPEAFAKVKFATPVPGGVGPVTVAMLALNVLKAKYLQEGLPNSSLFDDAA